MLRLVIPRVVIVTLLITMALYLSVAFVAIGMVLRTSMARWH